MHTRSFKMNFGKKAIETILNLAQFCYKHVLVNKSSSKFIRAELILS